MTLSDAIPVSTILRWQRKENVDNNNKSSDTSDNNEPSNQNQNNEECGHRFRVDPNLNTRIALWNGPLWHLQCDAIVNSSSESLRDTSGLCGKIMDAAGSQIWTECASSAPCRTGEAVVTRGCELPAKKIIHTVGPRYNLKYHNAAEHALHMCYRSSLCAAIEEKLGTVAFPCVYTKRKSYPRDEAAHIAIRTVRRFLEHYPHALELVVFCVDSMEDQWKYEAILPLYFPRTTEEAEQSAKLLASRDVGDAYGEPLIADRQIRIHSIGRHELQSSRTSYFDGNQLEHLTQEKEKEEREEQEEEAEEEEKEEDAHVRFCEMSIDPDIERLERLRALQLERQRAATKAQQLHHQKLHYDSVLAQAKTHDLSDLTALRFLYHGGMDHAGSPVIVYNANQLLLRTSEELERVLLYVIQFMDAIVEQQYSVLYLPSTSSLIEETQVNATFLKQLFQTLSTKYQQNLKFFYIFKPSMWFKLVVMVAKGFVSTVFYKKIVYLTSSTQVLNVATTLDVPDYVLPSEQNRNSHE